MATFYLVFGESLWPLFFLCLVSLCGHFLPCVWLNIVATFYLVFGESLWPLFILCLVSHCGHFLPCVW